MSSRSFQHEVPKARVNIKLDVHTGDAQKKVELPLKLLMLADYSNGREQRPLAARPKVSINRNNFDSVLADYAPRANFEVTNALAQGPGEWALALAFNCLKDFEPEQVARQVPQLRALLAMRNLLRDLKSNLLDNATFRAELERILLDPQLSQGLRDELARLEHRA